VARFGEANLHRSNDFIYSLITRWKCSSSQNAHRRIEKSKYKMKLGCMANNSRIVKMKLKIKLE
jgi:hypothetical protein